MTTWDSTVDVVIVGSGGGGMVAALTAADAGASALVLEKQQRFGGSTAMSGGIVWVPDNPVMRSIGVPDSYEDAMVHFEAVVGDVGPASTFERRHAFLTAGPEMVEFLQDQGLRFSYCRGYSDYYSSAKGGHELGRGIEPVPFDGRALGPWLEKLQPGLAQSLDLAVMTNEARSLSNYNRSVRAFAVSGRVVLRTYAARLRRQTLLTNGASLIAQMMKAALALDVPVWTEAPLEELFMEDGRVVGVRTVQAGSTIHIRARLGVVLASGGFAHNREIRERYGGRPAEPGPLVDRQPGGHRRGAAARHGARREDGPHGRGLVVALTPDRAVRAVHARPGPTASPHHLRRRRRKAIRERVELLHGSGQGDVRPGQDQPGGAVLAHLRRPLPKALRPPALPPRSLPARSCSRAG